MCCRQLYFAVCFWQCKYILSCFKKISGVSFTEPPGIPDVSRYRIVIGITDSHVEESVLTSFKCVNSHLQIVISTIAFGMGIDSPNVWQVVHFGPSSDIESYIKETGRTGRDGHLAPALLIRKSLKGTALNQELKKYTEMSLVVDKMFFFKILIATNMLTRVIFVYVVMWVLKMCMWCVWRKLYQLHVHFTTFL